MAQQQTMGIPGLLDETFEIHDNWKGLAFGPVVTSWLSHILTETDHRMSHVQPWAALQCLPLPPCFSPTTMAVVLTIFRLSNQSGR